MARRIKIDMDPANSNAIRYASNATGDTWTLTQTTPGDELARQVTILGDDVTNHSAKTALLTGTDADGKAQVETLNLPNGQVTVTSLKHFLTLTSVVPSATIDSDSMDIGIGDDLVSRTIPLNARSDTGALAAIDITGTIEVDVEITMDPPNRPDEFTWTDQGTAVWHDSTNMVADAANALGVLDVGAYAARFRINSYTDTAEVQCWITDNAGTG